MCLRQHYLDKARLFLTWAQRCDGPDAVILLNYWAGNILKAAAVR